MTIKVHYTLSENDFKRMRKKSKKALGYALRQVASELQLEVAQAIESGTGMVGHAPEPWSGELGRALEMSDITEEGEALKFDITMNSPYAYSLEQPDGSIPLRHMNLFDSSGRPTRLGQWVLSRGGILKGAHIDWGGTQLRRLWVLEAHPFFYPTKDDYFESGRAENTFRSAYSRRMRG